MATVAGAKRSLDISGNNITTAVSLEAGGTLIDTSGDAGTAGQVLSSTVSGVNWINSNPGDITGVSATSPLTGGGTSGSVTVGIQTASASQAGALSAANWTTFNNKTSNTGTTTASNTQTFTNKSGSNDQWTNDAGYITSYVNTTYTAGSGLSLTGTVFANTSPNIVQTTITGNAGSATVLQNARTIAGVSFNGSANISLNNNAITNGAGYTTNTGTTTASNAQTFTNKGGNISQWTNDSGYLTSAGDINGVTAGTNLNGGGTTGTVTLNLDSAIELTSVQYGSGVTLSESADRSDLLYINSSTATWGGLQIGNTSNEFIFSLMGDGSTGGIYDDQNDDWIIQWSENGGVTLYHNSGQKLQTISTGVNVTGNLGVSGDITVSGGDIVLGGTGRIQGIDTVSANLDAANKLYVDNAVAGIPVGDITAVVAGTGLSGGGTSGSVTLTNDITNNNQLTNGAGYTDLEIGSTGETAMAGDTRTITSGEISAISTNTAKTGITSAQASAITANTAKTGITSSQASAITANTAKTGITSGQASAITANTAKVGITTTQASNITTNNAKVGITTTQASNITTNNAKVTDTGTPAILSNGTTPSLNSGISAAEVRSLIGAGTSSASGTVTSVAASIDGDGLSLSGTPITGSGTLAFLWTGGESDYINGVGDVVSFPTTISSSQALAITANTAKTGITSGQASAITTNTAKTGITSGQASAITANTAKVGITSTQASNITTNNSKTGITSTQASNITTNNGKTGITSSQATAITNNTAKTGITSGQASAITANTAKVGITTTQASNITTNNGKTGITTAQASAITTNSGKTGITSAQATAITANTAKATNVTTNLSITGTTGARTIVSSDGTNAVIPAATASVSGVMSKASFDAVALNTAKVTDTGRPAILSDGVEPSLNDGMAAADIRSLIGAGTGSSNLAIGTTASTAKAGNTTTITTTQAANIVTNNGKVSNIVQTTVSGNAGTATTLQNARTIAGVSFNGSANISLNNNAITNGAGYTANTGDITNVSAGSGLTGGGTSGSVTVNVDYSGTDNVVLEAQDNGDAQIDSTSIMMFSNSSNQVQKSTISNLPFTNVTNTNQLTNGAGYITASSIPTIYTPDIWQIDDVANCNTNRLLVFDTVNIVNGTTGTNGGAGTAGMVRIASAGTYEITYSINIKARSGVSTRQAVMCYIEAGGGSVPGSSNTTYLRLAGTNQGGYTAMFNTSYITIDAASDIALRIFWLDGNTKSLDIYKANGIQNTVSIRRIT